MNRRKNGFTLVELVVVVMILGILAAVAAPRLLQTSDTATENGVRQTLAVIRDAIERHAAEHGGNLPGADGNAATFLTDIRPYLRGPFPSCPVGPTTNQNSQVNMQSPGPPAVGGTQGWAYAYDSGEFIINNAGTDSEGTAYSAY
jgi:prepilin-type N-terminal cleavage/methylation domain-containing protein